MNYGGDCSERFDVIVDNGVVLGDAVEPPNMKARNASSSSESYVVVSVRL